jgi:hypothetical protein
VLGDRGSGNTSLLRQVARRLREERCHRVELVDAGPTDGAESLLTLLAERLLPATAPSTGASTGLAPGPASALSEGGRLLALLDRLRRELPDVLDDPPDDRERGPAWEPGRPVVVLLDNASPAAAHVLMGRLRDETWSLPVVWVVAADRSAAAGFLEPPADTSFEARVPLPELPVEDAMALLRARVTGAATVDGVADELLRRIVDGLPVRTPRELVSALREVVEAGVPTDGDRITAPTLAAVDLVTGQQRERAGRLAHLGRSAAMLVAELQSRGGSASASDDGLLDALGWTRSRASQVFRQLEAADLVTASERRVNGAGRPRKVYQLVGRQP